MNLKKLHILAIGLLLLFACKEEVLPTGPSITITPNTDLSQAVCVGQVIEILVELKTSSQIGIEQFVIIKNNVDTIVNEQTILTNNLNYTFSYAPSSDDLAEGSVKFDLSLRDRAQTTVSETLMLDVEAEFGFRVDVAVPNPSWDLANNEALMVTDGPNVDILLTTESMPCGFGCTQFRMTFTSKNDTRFYNIPLDPVVNAFSNTTKTDDVLGIIAGLPALDELIVFSDFPEDIGANGGIDAFPVVVKIRGTEEYAIIGKLGTPGEFIYKKRSELAGN